MPDLFDPLEAKQDLASLIPEIGLSCGLSIAIDMSKLGTATLMASKLIEQARRSLPKQGRDRRFPGLAYTKQVAILVHCLLRTAPITGRTILDHDPNDEDGTFVLGQGYTAANSRICLLLCYHLLAEGVVSGNIWRLENKKLTASAGKINKICYDKCKEENLSGYCFVNRYAGFIYGSGPANFQYMMHVLEWDGISPEALSILMDHILYGACLLAPPHPSCSDAAAEPPPSKRRSRSR